MNTNYKKGFAPLVIILLVVLGIGVVGGGYFLYKDKQQQKKLETQIQDLQNQPVGNATDTTAPKVADKNPSSTTEKLVVTFPTMGAKLVEGQTYNITWSVSRIDNVNLSYGVYLENDQAGYIRVADVNNTQKSFSWKIPSILDYMNGGDSNHDVAPVDGYRLSFSSSSGTAKYYSPTFSIVSVPSISVADSVKKICKNLSYIKGAYPCNPSPDNKWIVYASVNNNSDDGLKLIEVATGKTTVLSKQQDDRAMLWFSDSQRILGFTGYFNQGGCEGCVTSSRPLQDSRMLTIWDISSKTHIASLGVQTPPWSYDMEWIIPDHTAYVYAVDKTGAEGDNFYYTLNLDNKTISASTKNPKLR